jgi:SSS sodium solute transporter superfamily/probable sodium:solute symporter, VC_2705 subfamily
MLGQIDRLGRIWGMYTMAFGVFVVLLWLAEYVGLIGQRGIAWTFMILTIGIYATIGIMSRTGNLDEYYVAGRTVPGIFNGMATASDWMSAASYISLAGTLYVLGMEGLSYTVGWTGGYVLLAMFLAPYIRKLGAYTIPDFVGVRYPGTFPRVVAVIAAIIVSGTYLVAQVSGVGIIMSRFLGLDFRIACFVGLLGILVCSMLGGMKAVTWTQVAQYIILIVAFILPTVFVSAKITGVPIPQLMYGQALTDVAATEAALGIDKGYLTPFNDWTQSQFLALIICLMCGTAGLPHVIVRFYTTPNVRETRFSVGWALFFIGLMYITIPAYAAFARWEVLHNVVGQAIDSLPSWVDAWTKTGLLTLNDANGNGLVEYAEFGLNSDLVVLAMPEIAGLPYVVAGLVAAGGLAAALSTADGLLMVVATAISHDIYFKLINKSASDRVRLTISRVMLVTVAAIAAWVASLRLSIISDIVAWAFSLAAASFFPILVLGIFWKRINTAGAITGMAFGLLTTLGYIIWSSVTGQTIGGILPNAAGIFGMPLNFLLTIVISLATAPPKQEIQALVERLRFPKHLHDAAAPATGD